MKVKNLIQKINPRSFISDYLIALGVPENEIEDYINPVNVKYQSPWDYPNTKLACEMVHDVAVILNQRLVYCLTVTLMVLCQ